MGTYSKFTPPGQKSLDAVTTGTGKAIPVNDCRDVTWAIVAAGTVSAGAVQIESAHDPAYAGTWKAIGSPITAVTDSVVGDKNGGPVVGGFIRARVSTNVTGGATVTVYINGLLG